MPASIQADISQQISNQEVDEPCIDKKNNVNTNQVKKTKNSTALLFGIWGMLTKLSLALAVGIAFPILDLAGLQLSNGNTNVESDIATFTLIILYALIPIILKIWVIVLIKNYQFDKNSFPKNDLKPSIGIDDENVNAKTTIYPASMPTNVKRL